MNVASPTACPSWARLVSHAEGWRTLHLREIFAHDVGRALQFVAEAPGVRYDYSRQRIGAMTLRLLAHLAEERGFAEWREALLSGKVVNSTEQRAAWHTALRSSSPPAEVGETLARMRALSSQVRKTFKRVVNLGTGGSDLGPRLLADALADGMLDVRFAANVDPRDLARALEDARPEETLFVIASKTFTTQETMANAAAARAWLAAALGPDAVAKHVIAATANEDAAVDWGLPDCNIFPFEEWVGGRYSVWSSVGLPVAIAVGMPVFEHMLAGAHAADLEFRSKALEHNVPALLGLIGIWNRDALGMASHAVLSYASRLEGLPAYLQQLEMESNGKSVTADGAPVDFETCPVVWGGTGTPGQHAFHQWLHQGTDRASCDFILVAHPMGRERAQHEALLANACAQSQALMTGVAASEAWRACPGDRVSTTFVLPELDAFHLGALLAIYEHKVFVQAAVWGINAFDQWGVELGKKIAGQVLPALRGKPADLHPATAHLLSVIRRIGESG